MIEKIMILFGKFAHSEQWYVNQYLKSYLLRSPILLIYLVLPATHKSIKILIISLYGGLPRFSTNLKFMFP